MDWLLKDAVKGGDVAYTTRLVNAISMFFLHQANPDVYEALEGTMANTRDVQELRNSPKQIGQLVAKQDNKYMMNEMMMANFLQMIERYMNKNNND